MSLRTGVLAACLFSSVAGAAPRKVLVLPLDGSADGAIRGKLNAIVQKAVREGTAGATVAIGDATFDETAAAAGCDAAVPACAVSVRATLGVDELVYGTVTTDGSGETTIALRRSSATADPPQELSAHLTMTQQPEEADRQIAPMFGAKPAHAEPPARKPLPPAPSPARDRTRRNLGIAGVAGGGVVLAIGLLLWASESGTQDDIDSAPANSAADIAHIRSLEDRAQKAAIGGDIMVLAGLALGGVGGYLLWKDHHERAVVIAPAATRSGPAVTIGVVW